MKKCFLTNIRMLFLFTFGDYLKIKYNALKYGIF